MPIQAALRQKLEGCKSLPGLPAVAVQVLRLCQRENFDMADVARAVGSDPGLAAKVVAMVNSPLFALRQEVRTVPHALVLLGVNAIRTIALSFSVVAEMRAHERSGFDRRAYWKRSLFAAAAAQELARLQRLHHPEEAFFAALLQDVGELALDLAVADVYEPLVTEAAGDHDKLVELEKRAFGCDHAEVGRWLMAQWRLPEIVRAAVGGSHDPARWQRGTDVATEGMVKVVALSGALADLWMSPAAGMAGIPAAPVSAATVRRACKRADETLGLVGDDLVAVLRRVVTAVVEAAPLFALQVSGREELDAVVDRVERIIRYPDQEMDGVAGRVGVSTSETPSAAAAAVEVDALTGLASRGRFDAYLARQFDHAQKVGEPLSVVVCDIDHFDMVNQAFGRAAGDRALAAVGALVGARLRHRDLSARYGGEEFALVLTDTHAGGAAVVAERLRKKIEEAQHDIGIGDPVRLTISLGCVTLDEALAFATPADLLAAVEQTLAQAKRAGRNRVQAFQPISEAA